MYRVSTFFIGSITGIRHKQINPKCWQIQLTYLKDQGKSKVTEKVWTTYKIDKQNKLRKKSRVGTAVMAGNDPFYLAKKHHQEIEKHS